MNVVAEYLPLFESAEMACFMSPIDPYRGAASIESDLSRIARMSSGIGAPLIVFDDRTAAVNALAFNPSGGSAPVTSKYNNAPIE